MAGDRARLEFEHDGRVARVTLSAPKANIVDAAMNADLESALDALEGLSVDSDRQPVGILPHGSSSAERVRDVAKAIG